MNIEISIQAEPLGLKEVQVPGCGAEARFSGIVRGEENGTEIAGLHYEAYAEMAKQEMRRILQRLGEKYPFRLARVQHRIGMVPVGESAIEVEIHSPHRAEAFAAMTEFMDRLKQDVPIWKVAAVPQASPSQSDQKAAATPSSQSAATQATRASLLHKATSPLHPLSDVWDCIDAYTRTLPAETISFHHSLHRVLAKPALAACDQPPFDQSAMDGYAISDPADNTWQLIETVFAGRVPSRPLQPGQCTRILTGAPIPGGTLAVLKQEDCSINGITVHSDNPWKPGQHIRRQGSAFQLHAPLIPAGTRINAGALALLASAEITQLQVLREPISLHLVTGSEVIPAGGEIQPGKIRDSNGPMIAAFLHEANIASSTQHTGDDLNLLLNAIEGFTGDLLLISGGSGPGDRDFTVHALEESGFTIHFSRINSRPGKPMIFASRGDQLAFGLPGNPLSHFVCYHAFVRRTLARLTGSPAPTFRSATLQSKTIDPQGDGRPTWSPAIVSDDGDSIQPIAWSHSGDLSPLATANALILSGADLEKSSIASARATCQYLPL